MNLGQELHHLADSLTLKLMSHQSVFERIRELEKEDGDLYKLNQILIKKKLENEKVVSRDVALLYFNTKDAAIKRTFLKEIQANTDRHRAELKRIDEMI